MKKTGAFISLLLALCLLFTACSTFPQDSGEQNESVLATENANAAETENLNQTHEVNIGLLKGPTGMGGAYLLEQNEQGKTENHYNLTLAGSPDVLTAALISGEIDIAALPVNTAAALYNKTEGKVMILAVNTLGVLYILDKTDSVKSVSDLKGKTILASGKGSAAEYVLKYILLQNGLKVDEDVTVEYAAEHAEALTKAVSGAYDIVMLPEPFVTQLLMKSSEFSIALDLSEEWKNSGVDDLTMGCLAARTEFVKENEAAVKAFMDDYGSSVAYVNENTVAAAGLVEKYEIATQAVAEKALPNCNIVFLTGYPMRKAVNTFLAMLYQADSGLVGGKLPHDDFFYIP